MLGYKPNQARQVNHSVLFLRFLPIMHKYSLKSHQNTPILLYWVSFLLVLSCEQINGLNKSTPPPYFVNVISIRFLITHFFSFTFFWILPIHKEKNPWHTLFLFILYFSPTQILNKQVSDYFQNIKLMNCCTLSNLKSKLSIDKTAF